MSHVPLGRDAQPAKSILKMSLLNPVSANVDASAEVQPPFCLRRIAFPSSTESAALSRFIADVFKEIEADDKSRKILSNPAVRKSLDPGKVYKASELDAGWRGIVWYLVATNKDLLESILATASIKLSSKSGLHVEFAPERGPEGDILGNESRLAAQGWELHIHSFSPKCTDRKSAADNIAEQCAGGYSSEARLSLDTKSASIKLHCGMTGNVVDHMTSVKRHLSKYYGLHEKSRTLSSHSNILTVEYRTGIGKVTGAIARRVVGGGMQMQAHGKKTV